MVPASTARPDRGAHPCAYIEKYLAMAPPDLHPGSAGPGIDLPLDGNHSFLGTDGCGVEIMDAFTGERRRTTKQDLMDVSRVGRCTGRDRIPLGAHLCPGLPA